MSVREKEEEGEREIDKPSRPRRSQRARPRGGPRARRRAPAARPRGRSAGRARAPGKGSNFSLKQSKSPAIHPKAVTRLEVGVWFER